MIQSIPMEQPRPNPITAIKEAYNYRVADWAHPAQAYLGLARTQFDGEAVRRLNRNATLQTQYGVTRETVAAVLAAPSELDAFAALHTRLTDTQRVRLFDFAEMNRQKEVHEKTFRPPGSYDDILGPKPAKNPKSNNPFDPHIFDPIHEKHLF